jgi:hypothetical protein
VSFSPSILTNKGSNNNNDHDYNNNHVYNTQITVNVDGPSGHDPNEPSAADVATNTALAVINSLSDKTTALQGRDMTSSDVSAGETPPASLSSDNENGRDKKEQPLRILATPWSPPQWMKVPVNGVQSMLGSAQPNGLIATPEVLSSWALYFTKFIEAYGLKGIDVWAITPQNEPQFAAPWEVMLLSTSDDANKNMIHIKHNILTMCVGVLLQCFI